jgi:hypothetical protein
MYLCKRFAANTPGQNTAFWVRIKPFRKPQLLDEFATKTDQNLCFARFET